MKVCRQQLSSLKQGQTGVQMPNAQDQKRADTSAQTIAICPRLLNLVVGWYLKAELINNAA
jgi:hypothetical protein